jgi:isochorismate hydrolase
MPRFTKHHPGTYSGWDLHRHKTALLIRDLQDLQVEIISTKSEETVDSLPGEIGRGEIHYEILCHGDGTVP